MRPSRSRWKVLTVASSADSSSPTSATTISPARASACLRTTTMSPSRMPGLDHRVALHAKEEVGVAAERLGNGDLVLDRLLGEQRTAGGDPSDERQRRHRTRSRSRRLLAPPSDELDRARLRRVAPQQAGALEVREMRVHGRRGGEPDGVADLPNGRWIAVRVHVLGEELPDLLLSCRQHRALQCRGTNVCSSQEGRSLPGRRQASGDARRTPPARARTGSRRSCRRARARLPRSGASTSPRGKSPSVCRSWTTRSSSPGPRATISVVDVVRRRARLAARASTRGSAGCARRRRRARRGRSSGLKISVVASGVRITTPPGRTCDGRGLDRRAEVVLRRQVRDRVVDEDDVERAAEPERAHVALEVLALGVERPAQREHLGRDVGERARRSAPSGATRCSRRPSRARAASARRRRRRRRRPA